VSASSRTHDFVSNKLLRLPNEAHFHIIAGGVVNCFGQIRMVKAFLPIFKQQAINQSYRDSQIVNVISMAGMLSGGGLGLTPYEVAKNAAEAFTDSLRLEMKMFGVQVVAVNPSFHKTPLVQNLKQRLTKDLWEPLSPDLQKEYGRGE
jgi:3-hydroxybutyrate dehydrogenase